MATDPNRDEFLEEDEQDELARRSIFSAGWFRALLVLTVLAIVVVVSLPYLLNWLEPTPAPPPAKTQAKSGTPAQPPAPAPTQPPVASPSPPTMIPAPAPPAPTTSTPPAPTPSAPTPSAKVETPAPPTKAETPKAPPAPAAPTPADRPVGTAPLPVAPAPSGPAAKTGPAVKQAPAAKSAQAEAPKSTTAPKQGAPVEGGSPGSYFVQVGAFLEEKNAETLAKQLRGESFPVQVSQITRGGGAAPSAPAKPSGGQNQLFITSSTPDAVNAALKGKGTAQAVKGGVVVNPPFDLETAMSLSSSLKKDGFKVVIRRAAKGAPPKAGGGPTYHVVRVGGYPDRAKAQQARAELEAKGHPGFLSQGAAR
jgi:cell division septation protein DedD